MYRYVIIEELNPVSLCGCNLHVLTEGLNHCTEPKLLFVLQNLILLFARAVAYASIVY